MDSFQEEHSLENENIPNFPDAEEFRRQGYMVIDFLAEYYQNIEKYPVLSQVQPGYLAKFIPNSPPYDPEPIETILQDVQSYVIPGLTHWQHPSFFGYFQGNGSLAGLLGEMLCTGFNVVGFNWISSPAATEMEQHVMDWLGQMLELPHSFLFSGNGGGVIHGSVTESLICTLTAARDRTLRTMTSNDADNENNIEKLVVYGSDQTHCSFQKAAQIVGINPCNIRAIRTTKTTQFGMSPESLKNTIEKDIMNGLVPFYVCAIVGTTSSNAVDPLKPICDIANEYDIWVHVDAAYAGAACICPEFRHFLHGIEGASSFSFSPHKWLLTTLECCCLWIKEPTALTMPLGLTADYLKNKATDSKQVVDYKDWQIAHTRRFRALKLWTVLRSYGVVNLRKHIRRQVRLAKTYEEYVKKDDRFEIVCPRNFALVCFRISPSTVARNMGLIIEGITHQTCDDGHHDELRKRDLVNEINSKLLQCVNDSGQVFLTHTVVDGIYNIRLAVGSTLVEDRHIVMAWKVVQQHADKLLTGNKLNIASFD